ncbi:uncharacterized protein LOC120082685 isoform X2 [Benincasa hispida]|uniref:uncharacterized protein LOC120082685 isoform X2 n=1 Tax=Benincasa hispida TaxID=102211 RepID=UPI0018FFFBFD|nr:uncharacterized protein LOC120082685 isoform X2 [Benincasa hispida]
MEDDDPNSVIQTHRSSIKTHPRYNNQQSWKQKLRENCCKRVREGRSRLLWKMRLPMTSPSYPHSLNNRQQDFIKSAFQDIFSDELKKIKDQSVNDYNKNLPSVPEAADVLWEYEGVQDAYEGEGEEILLEMQRIFYEDLNIDLRYKESEGPIVTWEDEEDEFLARAVYEHMELNSEKVTLDLLRCRLADVHAEHLDRGCRLKPNFCVESKFNITALYISCEGCNTFEVVI